MLVNFDLSDAQRLLKRDQLSGCQPWLNDGITSAWDPPQTYLVLGSDLGIGSLESTPGHLLCH